LNTGSIYQLLTPIVCFAFAAAFFTMYLYSRKKPSIGLFALSYFIGGLSFVYGVFRGNFDEIITSLTINGLYLLTLCILTAAISLHFSKKIPYLTLTLITTITLGAMSWFLLIDYSMSLRTAVMNFGAGLLLLPALAVIPRKNCPPIYKAIFWVLVVSFAQFYVRTSLTLYFATEQLTMETYGDSIYLVAFHFSMTLASVGLALTLCIAIGMEEIIQMRRLSETDALSGLVNRRGFEQEVTGQIEMALARKVPLSLIVCDIDHFKRINDTFGHDVGDQIIRGFAKIIESSCRRTDLVARIGGEEFCIMLPVATKEMALLVANSARETFHNNKFRSLPKGEFCSASFGVAQIEVGDTYETLFKRADSALYKAKQTGRNKSVVVGNPAPYSKSIGMQARARKA
jgi:diguanylate cyclase (GGDEF)-like protein